MHDDEDAVEALRERLAEAETKLAASREWAALDQREVEALRERLAEAEARRAGGASEEVRS